MAELLGRKPLFPGKDYVQQLDLITKVHTHYITTLHHACAGLKPDTSTSREPIFCS
jgi:hypothetical protein